MSLPERRKLMKERDAAYMKLAGVRSHDPVAEKMTGGNVYSRADIELLEREKLRFWRRRR